MDGREVCNLNPGEYVKVKRSDYPIPCVTRRDGGDDWVADIKWVRIRFAGLPDSETDMRTRLEARYCNSMWASRTALYGGGIRLYSWEDWEDNRTSDNGQAASFGLSIDGSRLVSINQEGVSYTFQEAAKSPKTCLPPCQVESTLPVNLSHTHKSASQPTRSAPFLDSTFGPKTLAGIRVA